MKKKLKFRRFVGISLGGGKNDRTSSAVLDYYPEHKKVFLSFLYERVKHESEENNDKAFLDLVESFGKDVEAMAFDVPLQLPKCIRCKLKCPGYENCNEPEIKWMWKQFKKKKNLKKNHKMFTPYTQRCIEIYLANELEENFFIPETLGANTAPLTARAQYLSKRIKIPLLEVYPPVSVWRIGKSLRVLQRELQNYKKSVDGDEARHSFIKVLLEKTNIFLYQQDVQKLVDDSHAFDAFICALTAYLKFQHQCEHKPKDFPKSEMWVDFPKEELKW